MKKLIQLSVVSTCCFYIAACTSPIMTQGNRQEKHMGQILAQGAISDAALNMKKPDAPPSVVNKALLPKFNNISPKTLRQGKTIDVTVNDVPIQQFFTGISQSSRYNVVVSPEIKANISLNLHRTTVPKIVKAVSDAYGYQVKQYGRTFDILPRQLETVVFTVNHLDITREGKSTVSVSTENQHSSDGESSNNSGTDTATDAAKVTTNSKDTFWANLKTTVANMIGAKTGRSSSKGSSDSPSVSVNPSSGVVVVRAYPDRIRAVAKFLQQSQNIMQREVLIEAKILEVALDDRFHYGIDWNLLGIQHHAEDITGPGAKNIWKITIRNQGEITNIIQLLQREGRVTVLSSPRITTMNNQKAIIKVGSDSYFLTGLSSNVSPLGSSSTVNNSVSIAPFFAGVALDVIPQIGMNKNVDLHIHPSVSRVEQENLEFTYNGTTNEIPTAKTISRESDSIVRAKSGELIIIGGLMTTNTNTTRNQLPLPKKEPFFNTVNNVIADKNDTETRTELVILLRPVVIERQTWSKELMHAADTMYLETGPCYSLDCLPGQGLDKPRQTAHHYYDPKGGSTTYYHAHGVQ